MPLTARRLTCHDPVPFIVSRAGAAYDARTNAVNLPSGALGADFKKTQYSEGNLMYRPGAGFTIGAALLWGEHVVADGSRADVFRLNFVFQYDLVDL